MTRKPGKEKPRQSVLPVTAAIVVLALAAHLSGVGNGFIVGYDDDLYIVKNEHVRNGLVPSTVWYAFTHECSSNWHPLTLLSHALDCTLFGIAPFGDHLVSVVLHSVNAALLFGFLWRVTGRTWPAAAATALFAVHPIHVESVASAAQRKDLLCALFWLLCMSAYVRYVRTREPRAYVLVLVWLACALMSKPVAVTLPFALLLLDLWPLRRLSTIAPRTMWPLVREKLPLFSLIVVLSVVTYLVQSASGAVQEMEEWPLAQRLANVPVAYLAYLGKALWPADLAAFYPKIDIPAWKWAASAAVVLLVSAAAASQWKSRPHLLIGWLWFLGTLVPMIGIVQVGGQSMADRYAYITFWGLYIAAAYGAADIAPRLPRPAVAAVFAALIVALIAVSNVQTRYWKDAITLWTRAVNAVPDNVVALVDLAGAYSNAERDDLAEPYLREALALQPGNSGARYFLGQALLRQDRYEEALAQFMDVVDKTAGFYVRVGDAFVQAGRPDIAKRVYEEGLDRWPDFALLYVSLGHWYESQKQFNDALTNYTRAKELNPALPNIDLLIQRARAARTAP